MENKIRVRFAPSPTGPLHIGGVRTALYNYLYAKKHNGEFILRIEDTDQTRYVEGAEEYIRNALEWLGLKPDEGPGYGGDHGPYRQSERKHIYREYAEKLISQGHAYYAFDTPEELEQMREREAERGFQSAKYDHRVRMSMRNSISLGPEESRRLIEEGVDYTVRLLVPEDETVHFTDIVRDQVSFNTRELDDKVILKKDGLPTYHLANIVDDHLMEITHVIRGEEWLSSTAHHILMYRYLGWETPIFTHLPLILKPTGKGKLSKRDGAKFGFPVFPLEWWGEEVFKGFREEGFDPMALLNFLVLLGWNPGTEEEIMSVERMIELFTLGKIIKSGARFDIDKARWFNQQYIIANDASQLFDPVSKVLKNHLSALPDEQYLLRVIQMMKERVHTYDEFYSEGIFFFEAPAEYDMKQVQKRYVPGQNEHFLNILNIVKSNMENAEDMATAVKDYLANNNLKMGVYLPLLRLMMCGSLKGPDLFEIMHLLGPEEVEVRMNQALLAFANEE